MGRWLKKVQKGPDRLPTQLTQPGSVSYVSAPTGPFQEKNASSNRWLAKLPRHLDAAPPAPAPTVAEDSPLASVATPEPVEPEGAPAPLQEVERIIEVLAREVDRDLGQDLEELMRRAMGPMDRVTRATLAAEIDASFETAQSVEEARETAAQAIRGRVGDPPPVTLGDWLDWIEVRCPINADDRLYLTGRLKWMAPSKLATACRWYAQVWAKVAEEERESHRKDNAGRRAANAFLKGART